MTIKITQEASDVLHRALQAASRFDPEARIRIHRGPQGIQMSFAHSPESPDGTIDHEGLTLFIEQGLEGVLTTGPHDSLILK